MGDPKKLRKKYKTPKHPWRGDQLTQELYLVGTYGLRNKRELWRAQTKLSRIRKQARRLLVAPADVRRVEGQKLLSSLRVAGVVGADATLDDALSLTVESLLSRRLQTIVAKKGFAKTLHQARQALTHGHITVKSRVVTIPGYIVKADEEDTVAVRGDSPLLRQVAASSAR